MTVCIKVVTKGQRHKKTRDKGTWELRNLGTWELATSQDEKKNHATSWDGRKKITQPLRTTPKFKQPLETNKITQPLWTNKNDAISWDKKITQPLRKEKNHTTSLEKNALFWDKKKSRNLL